MDLELERKKCEFNLRDVTREYEQMQDEVHSLHKQIVKTSQLNEEEITHMHRQLENIELKVDTGEKMIKLKMEEI